MNQSAIIVGSLFAAFFVYITVRGELPTYAGLLLLGPANPATTSANPAQNAQASSNAIVSGAFAALGL